MRSFQFVEQERRDRVLISFRRLARVTERVAFRQHPDTQFNTYAACLSSELANHHNNNNKPSSRRRRSTETFLLLPSVSLLICFFSLVFFCFLSIFYFVWFYWMGLCVRTVAIFRPIVLRATLRRTDARWRRRCLCHGRRVRCIRISIEVDIKRKENFDSVASHVCSYQTRWNRYLSSRQRRRVGKESKRNGCSFQPCLPFGQ